MPDKWEKYAEDVTPQQAGGDKWEKYAEINPTAQISAGPGLATRILRPVGEAIEGVGSSLWQTGLGGYGLLRKAGLPLPPAEEVLPSIRERTATPPTTAGKVGEFLGTAGQFLIPGAAVGRGVKAVEAATAGTKLSRLAPIAARTLGEAASAGGVEAVRSGGDIKKAAEAAALGGAAGGVAAAAAPIGKVVIRALTDLWGRATGAGGEALRVGASTARKEYVDAMRSKITETRIVQDVRDAVQSIAEKRAAAYQSAFGNLDQTIGLDLGPARTEAVNQLGNWGVRVGKLGLDFSGSKVVSKSEQKLMRQALQDVTSWADRSPAGLDTLKQRIYAYADSASPQTQPFFNRLGESIRKNLQDNVPGYKELTKEYAEASEVLTTVRKELSVGSKNPGDTLRKLQYAFNQNNAFRGIVLDMLDAAAGTHLKEELAGYSLKGLTARGLAGTAESLGILYHPAMLARTLTFGSPRVVGETMALISKLRRATPSLPWTPVVPAAVSSPGPGLPSPPQ